MADASNSHVRPKAKVKYLTLQVYFLFSTVSLPDCNTFAYVTTVSMSQNTTAVHK